MLLWPGAFFMKEMISTYEERCYVKNNWFFALVGNNFCFLKKECKFPLDVLQVDIVN